MTSEDKHMGELDSIIDSIRIMIGNEDYHQEGSLEVIKTMIQQRENRLIRRREAEAVREALQAELDTLLPQGLSSSPMDYVARYSENVNRLSAKIAELTGLQGGEHDS